MFLYLRRRGGRVTGSRTGRTKTERDGNWEWIATDGKREKPQDFVTLTLDPRSPESAVRETTIS